MGKIFVADGNPQQCEYAVLIKDGDTVSELNPRLDLANHSPTGLSWGYAGSGPAQCALAMLAEATGDDELALKYYQRYKAECVAHFPTCWQMPFETVLKWVKKQTSPYGSMCVDPDLCEGKGYCPRDPNCGE